MALLRLDPGLIIWLWITFGIIILILRFTVWGKITGALDKRSQKVASDIESARRAGEKATEVLAEYDQKIRDGKTEAALIIEEARTQASRLREELLLKTQEELRGLRERAAHEIEKAQEDATRALRGQVLSLSFTIADAILKRETGSADNRAFVEQFADKLTIGAGASGGAGPSRN
jgi:F-type H+-transporting ATPase subunit b